MLAHPSILGGLVDLLAPLRCPGCDLPLPPPEPEAPDATPDTRTAFCPACGPLLEPTPEWLQPPARASAARLYQGPLADAIRRFKYGGAGWIARPLGALLADSARPFSGEVDAVVPLALHPSKLRTRGYNPAALLAGPVARALGVPLRVHWLRRLRATRSQAGLARDLRLENVRGAFAAAPVPGHKLLLIDDVRTTGATLAEAAATLTRAGHDVATLALAWAES